MSPRTFFEHRYPIPQVLDYEIFSGIKCRTSHPCETHKWPNPPWKLLLPSIDFRLSHLPKQTTSPLVYQKQFLDMRESYPDHYSYTRMVHRAATRWHVVLLYQGHQIISASLQMQYFHCRNVCNFEALKYIESATLRRVVMFRFSQLSSSCLPSFVRLPDLIRSKPDSSSSVPPLWPGT